MWHRTGLHILACKNSKRHSCRPTCVGHVSRFTMWESGIGETEQNKILGFRVYDLLM